MGLEVKPLDNVGRRQTDVLAWTNTLVRVLVSTVPASIPAWTVVHGPAIGAGVAARLIRRMPASAKLALCWMEFRHLPHSQRRRI